MTSPCALAAKLALIALLSCSTPAIAQPDDLPGQRTAEEIQRGFTRNQVAIDEIYQRATMDNPALGKGKVEISFTIAPDGAVTACRVVRSSFQDAALERRIVQGVLAMRFEARDVPSFTVESYPLRFHGPRIPVPPADQQTAPLGSVRSLEEIQLAFDRKKGTFSSIYRRAAIESEVVAQGGKIIVRLAVAPDGRMTDSSLVSSTFKHPELESRILAVVQSIRLEAKDVPPYVYPNYPIVLMPPN